MIYLKRGWFRLLAYFFLYLKVTRLSAWLQSWFITYCKTSIGSTLAKGQRRRSSYLPIPNLLRMFLPGGGGCLAQWKHSRFPPSSPRFKSRLRLDFFSLLLSLWTVLRLNPSSAKQWISQMQLAVTFRAKCYKKVCFAPKQRAQLCSL